MSNKYYVHAKRVFIFGLAFIFLLNSLFLIPSTALAATSPWTQTDWSGGSGQTSWSDATKFSSSSSIDSATAGQTTLSETSNWYNTSWKYRQQITIDSSIADSDLTNFPALIQTTDSSNDIFSDAQTDGDDLLFTSSDGTTKLDHEIEKFDNSSGNEELDTWVEIPTLSSSTDTIVYMYYGNTSATSQQNGTGVWDSNFAMVQHLNETVTDEASTANAHNDSTSNNNDGDQEGNDDIAGKIAKGQDFDGNNDYIDITNGTFPTGSSTRTVEGWFTAGNNLNQTFFDYGTDVTGQRFSITANDSIVAVAFNGHNWGKDGLSLTGWHHIAVVFPSDATTSNQAQIYLDGIEQTLTNLAGNFVTVNTGTSYAYIGKSQAFAVVQNGQIDEVRISNTARSADWIKASYNNQNSPATYLTFASEEERYVSSGTLTSSIFDTENTNSWGTWGTLSWTDDGVGSVSVKVRTDSSSDMSGATAFTDCTTIASGSDLSSNNCVADADRYVQYQTSLTSSSANTPTLQDLSVNFSIDITTPASFDLNSPGGNSYTTSERPTFKWKATTDATAGLSKYTLEIDNPSLGSDSPAGDFTIDDIPVSRTTDYETEKYVIHYENFSDSDTTNNYISVYTKSSSQWSRDSNSGQNNGKLREGKVTWKVKARDNAGNETASSRTLFVDRTSPSVEFTQINNLTRSLLAGQGNSLTTTDRTPTIFGKITDSLSGPAGQDQNDDGPKVASGPKQVEIKIEKKEGLLYKLHTLYTINIDKPWYNCDNKEVADNSKQKCGKYLPFEYTVKDALSLGTYKITITGKDKADNTSSTASFTLNVTTLARIVTPEEKEIIEDEIKDLPKEEQEKAREELEITKPVEPSALEKTTTKVGSIANVILNSTRDLYRFRIKPGMTRIADGMKTVFDATERGLVFTGEKITQGTIALGKTTQTLLAYVKDSSAYSLRMTKEGLAYVGQGIASSGKSLGDGYNRLADGAPGVGKTVLTGIGNGVSTAVSTTTTLTQNTASTIGNAVKIAIVSTSNAVGVVTETTGIITQKTGTAMASATQNTVNNAKDGVANLAFDLGEKTQTVSEQAGLVIVKFGYNFVSEPTTIADVQVAILSSTSAKISWTTNHPANGKVNYGLDKTYPFDIQSGKRVKYHEFTLTDLEPNTTYFFEVMSQNKNYVYDANREFTTPAQ